MKISKFSLARIVAILIFLLGTGFFVLALSGIGQESTAQVTEPQTRQAALRIMPLGDSITQGAAGRASYRYWLSQHLKNAGYDFDFVGSHSVNFDGQNLYSDFDQDHEGHWGWRTDQILAQISRWAQKAEPNVVLMHLGTNDIFYDRDEANILADLGSIVDILRQTNADVTIFIAKLIPALIYDKMIYKFNTKIENLAASKNSQSSRIIIVDQYSGFNLIGDSYDGVHPTESGEQKLAQKWFAAIQSVFEPTAGQSIR